MDVTRAVCNIYAYLNAGYYIICMRRGGGEGGDNGSISSSQTRA